MSRAFVKGDDSDLSGEEVPERPISPDPNYVTATGLAQLRAKYDALLAEHAKLKAAGEDFDKPKLTRSSAICAISRNGWTARFWSTWRTSRAMRCTSAQPSRPKPMMAKCASSRSWERTKPM